MMENTYSKQLVVNASNLDAITMAGGEITKLADSIVHDYSDESIIRLYKTIINIVEDKKNSKKITEIALLVKENLLQYLGYLKVRTICTNELIKYDDQSADNLDELLKELNSLVGLEKVKAKVHDLISYQKIQKCRKENGLRTPNSTMHMAFTGNPGTGKTTVARIVGRIYKQLGLLSKGHFLEVSRTDLIAGYQGQTAIKVKNVIESIKGGVLFIDEAYSITENDHTDSYGRECLTELTKALEDYRGDLVVIVAGYTEPMREFFKSNPGLISRFNTFIDFDDYSDAELFSIFKLMCNQNDYFTTALVDEQVKTMISETIANKPEQFSNARFVRNLFENTIMAHARRVSKISNPTSNDLQKLTEVDIDCSISNM